MPRQIQIGVFTAADTVLAAAKAARKKGLLIHDVYTPYPVHGMDQAMGLKRSILSKLCFFFGATGLAGALSFQYWVSVYDWPMNIGGKTFHASPALIPVAFELTVLFAGLGTVAALFHLRRMFPGKKPFAPHLGATDDRFLLAINEQIDGADPEEITAFLKEHGAETIEEFQPT